MSDEEVETTALPSLGFTSAARLSADVASVVFGLVSATITARLLGADGKGTLSSLLFIGVLLSYAASLGLGDASIILIQQKRASLRDAVPGVLFVGLGASVLMWGALAIAMLVADWTSIWPAVLLVGISVPVMTTVRLLTALENALEGVAFTSFVFAIQSGVGALGLVLLVVGARLGITGAALAPLLGSAVALMILVRSLYQRGISFRSMVRRQFVAAALRVGAMIEISFIVAALAQRVDLLIVYSLAGEAPAGRYSIALTLAQLANYAPFALSIASFPRLAGMERERVSRLIEKLSRAGLAAAMLSVLILVVAIPYIIRIFFGSEFTPAIRPALMLLAANFLWSEQWLFARAAAARGDGPLYLMSLGAGLVSMVALDLLLVPRYGIEGAAIASIVAPTVGFAVALAPFRRRHASDLRLVSLVPRGQDFRLLFDFLRSAWRRFRGRTLPGPDAKATDPGREPPPSL